MKKVLIGLLMLVILSGGIAYLWMQNTKNQDNNKILLNNIYKVDEIKVLDGLIFTDSNNQIYFKSEEGISKYNLRNRKTEIVKEISDEFIFDIVDDEIVICNWENYLIENPNDIASKFWIEDIEGHIINEFETNKTVRPVTCGERKLFAIDNYPNSLERYYLVDLEIGNIKEDDFAENKTVKIITKDDKTEVIINNMTFEVDYPNIFINTVVVENEGQNNLVLVDLEGRLWVVY